jgi:hypothetical protein
MIAALAIEQADGSTKEKSHQNLIRQNSYLKEEIHLPV